MNDEKKCPIWGADCEDFGSADLDGRHIDSPRAGGKYEITGSVIDRVGQFEPWEKAKLSRWIYEQNQLGKVPRIDSDLVRQVSDWPMPSVPDRIDYLLQFAELKARGAIGYPVRCSAEMGAATAVSNKKELVYLIQQADEMELINILEGQSSTSICDGIKHISAKGYQRIEELKKTQPNSAQAFVAMWFDDTMNDAWEKGFEPAIIDAGYKPMRIDRKEHINKIDDEIIAEIRRSRFLVADFTSKPKESRGGVYYEAGFAHGLNIPVIYTCRKDCLKDVHFDTRQFNHLRWNTPESLRTDLARRISSVLGDGPHRIRKQY